MVRASDSRMGGPGFDSLSRRLPSKLSLRCKGRPVVKSTATSDLQLVRGGLPHPVSQVTDAVPPLATLRGRDYVSLDLQGTVV